MQLKEVRIANYRNFEDFTTSLENFSVVIGTNNAGKTNFLQALELVFAPIAARNVFVQKHDFRDPAKPIVIDVVLDKLTEHDKGAFFHDEGLINPLAGTITIRFESVWTSLEQDVWNECYFVRDDLPNEAQRVADFSQRFKQQIPLFTIPPSRSASQEMSLSSRHDFGRIVRLFAGDYLRPIETMRQEVTDKLRSVEKEKDHFEDFPEDVFVGAKAKIEKLLEVVEAGSFTEIINKRGIKAVLDDLADFHEGWETKCKALLEAHELEPKLPLAEQLKSLLEKATILSNRCAAQVALCNLRDSMVNAQQFERLGTEFDTVFSEVMPSQRIELSLFPIQDDELISKISVDIDSFPLLEHGSGYQSIFVVGLKLMRTLSQLVLAEGTDIRNFILAIEEPEVHLHPHMQRHLVNGLRRLQRLWEEKGYHLQVIVTTHSPSVVSRVSPHELIAFQRQSSQTKAIKWRDNELQMIAEEIEPDESKIGKKYDQLRNWCEFFLERYADVFFSNCVIVVEGETEEGAISVWAGKLPAPVDFDQLGISLVNAKGDNIAYVLKILDRFGIEHVGLFDRGDEHFIPEITYGALYTTHGKEFEDDLMSSARISSIIRALEFISSIPSNEHRLGWVRGHIQGWQEFDSWESLLEVLDTKDPEQHQVQMLQKEALRWIKKSNVKSLAFGRAVAKHTSAEEVPPVCETAIKEAAERAQRKIGEANG